MDKGAFDRRDVVNLMVAAGAIGLPGTRTFSPNAAHAAGAVAYDPNGRFDLSVSEVELRRNSAGRVLMARIYQPQGLDLFPLSSICTAGRGMEKTDLRKSRWTARSPQAACWWSQST